MKAEDIKIDLKKFEEERKKNAEERMKFIDYWANYVKTHPDEEWSKQQNILINGQLSN
jgi:hypothetical protein